MVPMSDFFSFRDSMEPTGTGALRRSGGGAGAGPEGELAAREKFLNYGVEARDGHVGKVMDVEPVHGKSHLIVATGGTIFSRIVMIPAGTVERADHHAKKIYLDLSKEDVKNSPEFDERDYVESTHEEQAAYRDGVASHYADTHRRTGL